MKNCCNHSKKDKKCIRKSDKKTLDKKTLDNNITLDEIKSYNLKYSS